MTDPAPPLVSMVMIAKDEAHHIKPCFDSWWDHVDQAVLVDTGSSDATLEAAQAYAQERGEPGKLVTGTFEWCDDFAAARTHADSLAAGQWLAWCDLDDTITHPGVLRTLAQQAPSGLNAYVFSYNYAQDVRGQCICTLKRERLVRAGAGRWEGAVHEAQSFPGGGQLVAGDVCEWVHQKGHAPVTPPDSNERNLRILRAWVQRDPENPRVLGYLGTEEAARGNHDVAVDYFHRYLALKTGWDEERAQVHRKLGMSLYALDRREEARRVALDALLVLPNWTDSYLTLAQTCYALGEFPKAIEWAHEVLRRGMPESLLILNPRDYDLQPKMVLAGALGAVGRLEEALALAQEALALAPDHDELRRHAVHWQERLKREHTAATFAGCAEMLVAHDEQLKALDLLERVVPHFAQDHPTIVGLRSQLRERVQPLLTGGGMAAHYAADTEEGIDDLAVVENLPRAHFLKRSLLELAEAA